MMAEEFFKQQTKDDVLTRLQGYTTNDTSKIEGTFNYDVLSASAIEFSNTYNEINLMIDAAFADTSWGDYLTGIAEEYGVIRKQAQNAVVNVTVKGNPGAKIIKNSLFSTSNDIKFYTVDDAIIDSTGQIVIKCVCADAGIDGNVEANTITKIPYSIPGVISCNNEEKAHDGYDIETDASLLERYLLKVRTPATSGNTYHYKQWALSIAGVGQVKVLPLWAGNGTVKVLIINNNNQTASADLIAKVNDYITSVMPIGCTLTIDSPAPYPINITFKSAETVDTDLIKSNVNDYFNKNGFGLTKISIAQIGRIILNSNVLDYDYDSLKVNDSNTDIALSNNQLPCCGEVTIIK